MILWSRDIYENENTKDSNSSTSETLLYLINNSWKVLPIKFDEFYTIKFMIRMFDILKYS
jgi:hypothetical protein